MARGARHEFEAAARYYAAAADLEDSNALAYFRWGKLLLKRRHFHEAATVLERAAALAPDHAPTWYALAQSHFGAGDYQRADAAALAALQNDPNHSGAFLIRLRCAQLSGDARALKALLSRLPKGLAAAKEVRQIADALGITLPLED